MSLAQTVQRAFPGNRLKGPRTRDRALIEAANVAYHEAEAELYDVSHPEILWCERAHWEAFGRRFLSSGRPPYQLLDIGAGTGFIAGVLGPFLGRADRYVATDLSPEMLAVLSRKLTSFPAQLEVLIARADALPFEDASFDVAFINSALHHFPDVEGSLREAARVVKPGGIFAVMHEPNIRFTRSWFSRQLARVTSVVASRIDRTSAPAHADYTPVFAHVNQRLQTLRLISEPLASREIQALVDVHSPTARGRYEAIGFDPPAWLQGPLRGWNLELLETYNHLGKLEPSSVAWRRAIETVSSRLRPNSGYLFSFVARKPR